MDEKLEKLTSAYDEIVSMVLSILTFKFQVNLSKAGIYEKVPIDGLLEILNILDKSMDETEQQIHKVYYGQIEKGEEN